jgi:hypothetical protein
MSEAERMTDLGATNGMGRNSRMEQVITFLVDNIIVPLANFIAFAVGNGIAFVIFAVLSVAFAWAVVASQGSLHAAWQWSRELPLLVQGLVWVLFLPVVVALWIWETTWPLVLRLLVISGLAGWSLLMFLPKRLTAARP